MRKITIALLITMLVAILVWFGCENKPTAPEADRSSVTKMSVPAGAKFAPDRILVKFVPGANVAAINAKMGASELHEIPGLRVKVLRVPANRVENMIAVYNRNPNVEYAEPDYITSANVLPNDPEFANQWGLHNTGQTDGTPNADINAPEAWYISKGNSVDKIAILDTGIDQDHEDLSGKIVLNHNFTDSPDGVDDIFGHGTHVAGIAAAVTDNAIGVAGVGWDCSLMNVKVIGDNGSGYTSWSAQGIIWAADNGAKVINMSYGSYYNSRTERSAVRYAWKKGVVLVAAAGNQNTSQRHFPAAYSECIAVAATDHNDTKAGFSNWGSDWVDVAAPGDNVFSTLPNHWNYISDQIYKNRDYDYLSGTSMASPFVAGVAGLVWSSTYATDNESVRERIESTCNSITGTGTYWAHGRVNAYNAVVDDAPSSIDVTVLSVNAENILYQGNYNITANIQIQYEGESELTIHVDCMVKPENGHGRKQKLTTQEFTIHESTIVTAVWNEASILKMGFYIAEVTVQEDPDVGENTDAFQIQ